VSIGVSLSYSNQDLTSVFPHFDLLTDFSSLSTFFPLLPPSRTLFGDVSRKFIHRVLFISFITEAMYSWLRVGFCLILPFTRLLLRGLTYLSRCLFSPPFPNFLVGRAVGFCLPHSCSPILSPGPPNQPTLDLLNSCSVFRSPSVVIPFIYQSGS